MNANAFLSAGCVNKQLLANMLSITLVGDNMSMLGLHPNGPTHTNFVALRLDSFDFGLHEVQHIIVDGRQCAPGLEK